MKPPQYTNLNPDQSAEFLRLMILNRQPFFFARYGDGYLECVHRRRFGGATCDREGYTPELSSALEAAWKDLREEHVMNGRPLVIADWISADFDAQNTGMYPNDYAAMMKNVRRSATFVNYEALMLNRMSEAIVGFYAAVKADKRRKVLVGPIEWAEGSLMLDTLHIDIPTAGLWEYLPELTRRLDQVNPELVLFGSGMAGTIPMVNHAVMNGDCAFINIGSSLDPLFRGKTRRAQLDRTQARTLFAALL